MNEVPGSNRAIINEKARPFDGKNVPIPPAQFNPNLNPYDAEGAPGLATSYIDINCDCVDHIRKSRCDLMFQSFASCHNAVIRAMHRQKQKPMFFQCQGAYTRLNMCFEHNGLSGSLVDENAEQAQQEQLYKHQTDLLKQKTQSVRKFSTPMVTIQSNELLNDNTNEFHGQ